MVYREAYSKYLRKKLSNFIILFILAQRLWFFFIFVVMCNALNVLACFLLVGLVLLVKQEGLHDFSF